MEELEISMSPVESPSQAWWCDEDAVDTPPPQTIHYWTSDDTRRLEYAAIDATSRGFSGWIRRHLMPACVCPKHIAFDEEGGSVRRYRLHLEDEPREKTVDSVVRMGRKRWHVWPSRKSSTEA